MLGRTFSAILVLGLLLVPCVWAQFPPCEVVLGEEAQPPGEDFKPGLLNSPFGIDFDGAGTMYIVELAGGRVHKLATDGTFTTIAGDGTTGYAGDGGPARSATFNGMHNVAAMPNGDLFIADSWNHCVRKIDGSTGIITTFAGTGEAGFAGDGGPASAAKFDYLMCVTLNPAKDKLYIADLKNLRIRMIDLATNLVMTVAGNGNKGVPEDGALPTQSPLLDPRAVAVDSKNNVYILERGGHSLRRIGADGRIYTVAGTGEKGTATGPALASQMNGPKHLAIDHQDRVIVADEVNARICLYDPVAGTLTEILGPVANRSKLLKRPHGVCVHADGSLYIADTDHHRILRMRLDFPQHALDLSEPK